MANRGRSSLLWVLFAIVALPLLTGCNGFFVDPTLVAIAIAPQTPTIATCPPPPGSVCTVQMTATGTFSDGTQGPVTVSWSSSPTSVATINAGGLVTAVSAGTATITAASGTVSSTTTVTVALANIQSIVVTPTNPSVSLGSGTEQFTATANLIGGGTQDVTGSVTWTSSANTVATISSGSGNNPGKATLLKTGSTTITATSGSVFGTTLLTVN